MPQLEMEAVVWGVGGRGGVGEGGGEGLRGATDVVEEGVECLIIRSVNWRAGEFCGVVCLGGVAEDRGLKKRKHDVMGGVELCEDGVCNCWRYGRGRYLDMVESFVQLGWGNYGGRGGRERQINDLSFWKIVSTCEESCGMERRLCLMWGVRMARRSGMEAEARVRLAASVWSYWSLVSVA